MVLPELKTTGQVETHIANQITNGANGIKIWAASPTGNGVDVMSDSLIRKAAEVAHLHHLPVFAHPTNIQGVEMAVNNGVDVIAHVAPDDGQTWNADLLKRMKEKKVSLILSLKLFSWELARMGVNVKDHPMYLAALKQAGDFSRAGGDILFGTDVGYVADYDPTEEFSLMAEAGMSFSQILAALTINPARKFKQEHKTGTIKVGLNADLVILKGDPATDAKRFAQVAYTIHNGKVIYASNKTSE